MTEVLFVLLAVVCVCVCVCVQYALGWSFGGMAGRTACVCGFVCCVLCVCVFAFREGSRLDRAVGRLIVLIVGTNKQRI